MNEKKELTPTNFIHEIIEEDLKNIRYKEIHTRFPPEPNGYLHIGHAKSICLNFTTAAKYGGKCNLRFDDTNPCKEDIEYVNSIMEDIKWLGFDWEDRLYFASDYFEQLYQYAIELIKAGKAYVCNLSPEEIKEYRGTLTVPGKESPYRNRSIEENLDLFERMRKGEFQDGSMTLRAKVDMSSPNLNMRDPVLYRILNAEHHRTGNKWCIYPMYDYAHPLSDAIEHISHSICTLEFEDHRPLYDWLIQNVNVPSKPRQIEFARLNLSYTVMSKRKLLELVKEGVVDGWDDPRMPTISGLRRRGYTPESIREFAEKIGVSKRDNLVDISFLEYCIRKDLNLRAPRVMAVLKPLKIIIDNYPANKIEELDAINNPEDLSQGLRKIPFSREIYIEEDDFCENPPSKYYRLAPGREIRLKYAYIIKCEKVIKDESGKIVELHCTYDPATKSGDAKDTRKMKVAAHWVSAPHAIRSEVRLYDHLFTIPDLSEIPDNSNWKDFINPNSLIILNNCKLEPNLANPSTGEKFQFLRQGYFCVDTKYTTKNKLVFNRTVTLKGKGSGLAF